MSINNEPEPQIVTIILQSGSYDRVTNALSLALVSMAMGMEAYILLTYGGLDRFIRGHLEDDGDTDPRLLSVLRDSIDEGHNHSIEQKLATAHDMGLKIYGCTNAMDTLGIALDDLVDEVEEAMGFASFIQIARDAAINWYI
jgi:peroxiredoxin family protein